MTHGNADAGRHTMNTIASLLRESPGKFNAREVYFITDMQHSGCRSATSCRAILGPGPDRPSRR